MATRCVKYLFSPSYTRVRQRLSHLAKRIEHGLNSKGICGLLNKRPESEWSQSSLNGSKSLGISAILLIYLMVSSWLPQLHTSHPHMGAPGREAGKLWELMPATSSLQNTPPRFLDNVFPRSIPHIPPYISLARTVSHGEGSWESQYLAPKCGHERLRPVAQFISMAGERLSSSNGVVPSKMRMEREITVRTTSKERKRGPQTIKQSLERQGSPSRHC